MPQILSNILKASKLDFSFDLGNRHQDDKEQNILKFF